MFLILFAILLLFFILNNGLKSKNNKIENLNTSTLLISIYCVFITEFLSATNKLNTFNVIVSWILLIGILVCSNIINKNKFSLTIFKNFIYKIINSNDLLFKILIFLVFLLIFIQCIIYPPNNYDSMTYHLGRIVHWTNNHSVHHFPTNIFRQIYQPPFSEFLILQDYLIFKGDYFSNTIQFFFLLLTALTIYKIITLTSENKVSKLTVLCLIISIPEVILQASSTQNDIIVAYFILNAIYFLFKLKNSNTFKNISLFALSIALGILTKGTAYIYFFPIILIFLVLQIIQIKENFKATVVKSIVFGLIILSVNIGHITRNYKLNKTILGTSHSESKMYSNLNFGPTTLVSNIIKNTAIHFNNFKFNEHLDPIIYDLFDRFNIGINNKNVNFGNMKFTVGNKLLPTHEDYAANTLHLILILISTIFIVKHLLKKEALPLNVTLILLILYAQFLLFCFYLKWQPWHTRLHTPMFLLSIPLIHFTCSNAFKNQYIKKTGLIFLIFCSFMIIIFNETRPLLRSNYTTDFYFTGSRYKNYFTNNPELYSEYLKINKKLVTLKPKQVGLILNPNDYEYPLFNNIVENNHMQLKNIKINNETRKYMTKGRLDIIISTNKNTKTLKYNDSNYKNITNRNNKIWMFKLVNNIPKDVSIQKK